MARSKYNREKSYARKHTGKRVKSKAKVKKVRTIPSPYTTRRTAKRFF